MKPIRILTWGIFAYLALVLAVLFLYEPPSAYTSEIKHTSVWPVGGLSLCSPPDEHGRVNCIRIPDGSVLIVPAPPDSTDDESQTKS